MNDTAAGQAQGLEILDKSDAVLRALTEAGELRVAELAAAVDEPASSLYRLLNSLIALGLVEAAPKRGFFRLGVDLLRIGGLVEDQLSAREAAVPELKALRKRTNLTSFLCIRVDSRAVCIERFEGRDVRSLALALGQSLPLHHGAAPRAILAFLPESERRAIIASGELSPADVDIERVIEEVRGRGYAVSDGDVTPGIAAVGAPVFNHRGGVEAALSVSGVREHVLDPDGGIVAQVVAAAAAASEALGFEAGRVA